MKNITFNQACRAIFGAFACSVDDGVLTYFSEDNQDGEEVIYFDYESTGERVRFFPDSSKPKIKRNGVISMYGRRSGDDALEPFDIALLKLDANPKLD